MSALDAAVLRSGMYRTAGVAGVMSASLVAMLFRRGAFEPELRAAFTLGPMALVVVLVVFEYALLVGVRRALRLGRRVPTWVWVVAASVESAATTGAIAAAWAGGLLPPDKALTTPPLIAYASFMTLWILQLRPWLTGLMVAMCSVQYAALVVAADVTGQLPAAPGSTPIAMLYMFAVMLALTGACALFVAARARRYVETAVNEQASRESAEREIRTASQIQSSVLPHAPPDVRGFTIHGWNRQAQLAGGDYFDWIERDNGQVVVSLADVAGHGLGPALLTAYCRAYARGVLSRRADLGRSLAELNTLVGRDLPEGRFVTFVAGVLTPGSDDVEILSAGHGPMYLYRAREQAVEVWNADELPLGVSAEMTPAPRAPIRMLPGDVLLLASDGLFEWRDRRGGEWGTARLREALRRLGSLPPIELIPALYSEVEGFCETPPGDDVTMVTVHRVGRRT